MEREEAAILSLAKSLMAAASPSELFRQLATSVRQVAEADWVAVWTYERRKKRFSLEMSHPEEAFSPAPDQAGRKGDLLAEALDRKELVARRGEEIRDALLQHLGPDRETPVGEAVCVPFTLDGDRVGLLEMVRRDPTPSERSQAQARFLSACSALASSAAASLVQAEAGRERQMAAINRLMQLYDVSQTFHATLEREALLPVIANRIAMMFEASVCRIWLPAEGGETLERAWPPADEEPERLAPGAMIPGTVFQSGESVLVADVAQAETAGEIEEFYGPGVAGSLVCAPLIIDGNILGAIDIARAPGEPPYGQDEKDLLEEISRQAALAVRNANLLIAERKARELDALLEISREITATLDLDRVLATIVNRADSIVPCDRCAIILGEGRAPALKAVSDKPEIDRKDPAIRDLEEILTWAYLGGQGLYLSEIEGAIETDREETREKFRRFFERSGMKTFLAFPLKDEEGLLGVLSLESSQPYFVSQEKLEVCHILANQATVAIRNATLYRQIPLINLMGPIAGWKARLAKIPRWKWLRNAAFVTVVAAALILVPWNMKIAGRAVVLPARNSSVTTEIEGIVDVVYRREGDRVPKGDLLATLMDRDYRMRMEEARTGYEIADREVAQGEADHDPPAARQARIRRDQQREEYELRRHELDKTRIVAPVDGVVLTPRIEQKAGSFLQKGEVFCRIADMKDVAVEVFVPETTIAEIRTGQIIRLKIDSFPTRTFLGRVEIVGQKVIQEVDGRFLVVRGRVEGADLPLKTGMLGRAKIEIGRRALGYVLLRRPAGFLWRTLWSWMP